MDPGRSTESTPTADRGARYGGLGVPAISLDNSVLTRTNCHQRSPRRSLYHQRSSAGGGAHEGRVVRLSGEYRSCGVRYTSIGPHSGAVRYRLLVRGRDSGPHLSVVPADRCSKPIARVHELAEALRKG
jgi:hypothetical protein